MTQINIKIETKTRLEKLGHFRDTMDDIIKRLLDGQKKSKKK